jgi:hypothetical protein
VQVVQVVEILVHQQQVLQEVPTPVKVVAVELEEVQARLVVALVVQV